MGLRDVIKHFPVITFLDEINIEITGLWVEQSAIHNMVGLIQSVQALIDSFPSSKGDFAS